MRRTIRFVPALLAMLGAVGWASPASAQLTASSGFGNRSTTGGISGTTRSAGGGGSTQQSLDLGAGLLDQIAGAAFGETGIDRGSTGGFFGQRASSQQGGGFFGGGGTTGRGGGFGGRGGFGGFGGRNNRNNFGRNNNQESQMYYRPRRTVAFAVPEYAAVTPSRVTDNLVKFASRAEGVPLNLAGVSAVASDSRQVVLRGTAATDHDRALAERLALLEPGVSEVVNEIQVANSAPAPSTE